MVENNVSPHPRIKQILDRCYHDSVTGCILFKGKFKRGQLEVKWLGKRVNATRLLLHLICGEELTKMHVTKICNSIRCLNVSHMRYETIDKKYHAVHVCPSCGDNFDSYHTQHTTCMACYAGTRRHMRTKKLRLHQALDKNAPENRYFEKNVNMASITEYLQNEVYDDYPSQHRPREGIAEFKKRKRAEMIEERLSQ